MPDTLRAALAGLELFFIRDGEGQNDTFERIGEVFHAETRYLRPGKDCRLHDHKERQAAWDAWVAAKLTAARAALAAAPAEQGAEIDYGAAIAHCFSTLGHAQGTKGCVAFCRGAEWGIAQLRRPALPEQGAELKADLDTSGSVVLVNVKGDIVYYAADGKMKVQRLGTECDQCIAASLRMADAVARAWNETLTRPALPEPAGVAQRFVVHVAGPDDLHYFDDELAALQFANATNKAYLADRLKHPNDEVLCVAEVYPEADAAAMAAAVEGALASAPPAPQAPAAPQGVEADPFCYAREWDGDVSDVGMYVFAMPNDELDGDGWFPLFLGPPAPGITEQAETKGGAA